MRNEQQAKIETLASQILLHKKLYYTGRAAIPDAAYDALEDELRALDPQHPVLAMVGYTLSGTQSKVSHEPPMLSLAKTYEVDDLQTFLAKACVCSDKLDGMALALEYDGAGRLLRASTRGSGRAGEDVTEHVFHVGHIPKRLHLPESLLGHSFEVRGEVFFPISAFEPFSERFDSYRNAVPGTFGRKEVEGAVDVLRCFRFCAYDFLLKNSDGRVLSAAELGKLLGLPQLAYLDKLKLLEKLELYTGLKAGFVTRMPALATAEQLGSFLNEWFSRPRDYQIDGVVFRLEDEALWENLGTTSHHPRGSLAFKQTGEVAVTRILAIEEAVGRSGKITFRARLEPVFLSGATISYATLHNAEFIEAGQYAPGALVKIKRSGEVIPAIIGLEEPAKERYTPPATCPCGYPVSRKGPDLFCLEKRPCPHKDQEALVHFVSSLDIMGVSDKIILKLREAGLLSEPADLFKITVEDLLSVEGFAQKSAENVVRAIQEKRRLPLASFLTALGLKRGGAVKCAEVARRFGTLAAVRAACPADLMVEKGWADKSAEDFCSSLAEKSKTIDHLLRYVEVLSDESGKALEQNKNHPLFGKSVCITGELSRPREEYKALLERLGAKVVGSVSSKTSFLVCNEASSSSKFQQAVKLGIPILNEQQLRDQLS